MMCWMAEQIRAVGAELDLIYSVAVPLEVLRRRIERQALTSAIADAPCQAIWIKTENFGDDASGDKTTAHIEACRDFHDQGLPVVGDHYRWTAWLGGAPLRRGRRNRPRRDNATELQRLKLAPATNCEQWWTSPTRLLPVTRRIVEAKICAILSRQFPARAGTMRMSRHALLSAGYARHDCSARTPCSLSARPRDRDPQRYTSIDTGSALP